MASDRGEDGLRRHINGVVSNGVVPKSQICKLVAKSAPDIFRIQGVYHNCRDKAALFDTTRFDTTRFVSPQGPPDASACAPVDTVVSYSIIYYDIIRHSMT